MNDKIFKDPFFKIYILRDTKNYRIQLDSKRSVVNNIFIFNPSSNFLRTKDNVLGTKYRQYRSKIRKHLGGTRSLLYPPSSQPIN